MKLENKVIRLMADYGAAGDLAFSEVEDRLHHQIRPIQAQKFEDGVMLNYHIEITPVRAFSSVENAFLTAQLAINSPLGSDYIIYNNVAPRKDDLTARQKNAGEPFIYLKLKHTIVYNDGYGNLKTTVPVAEIEAHKGERRTVMINGRIQYVTVGEGIFSVQDGEFCLAKGSSGWEMPDGSRFDFVELVKRGGSAYAEFAKPPAGLKVKFPDTEK